MRSTIALAALAVLLTLTSPVAAQYATDENSIARVTVQELKKLQASDAVVVVDVRAAESYAEGHIPGALSVPLDDLKDHLARLKALNKPIVTYCA